MSDGQSGGGSDSTSFASILANVQRLRGEASSAQSQSQSQHKELPRQQPPEQTLKRPRQEVGTRINAFNQDRSQLRPQSQINRPSTISVNKSQTGNPLLKHITNVNWSYVESRNPYDYLVKGHKVLFLSLKYHKLHPEYIGNKMKQLVKQNAILLTVVDVENTETILKEINKICLFNEFTLLLSFNFEQAAKYLTFMATSSTISSTTTK